MKILFCPCHYVFDEGDRGSELSWAFQIANRIALTYPESTVVTGFKNLKSPKPYKIIELQPHKQFINMGIINTLHFNYLYSKLTLKILKKEKPDVLHHVLPFAIDKTFNLSFIFTRSPVLKVIGPIQNSLPFYKDNTQDVGQKATGNLKLIIERIVTFYASPVLAFLSKKTLESADKIIVINEATKKLLLQRNIEARKIIIIPPGVDTKKFAATKKKEKNDQVIELLAVGTLIERKGFDVLLEGFAEVVKTHSKVRLRIVGDGPQKEFLEQLVEELHISKYIFFEGYIPYHKMFTYYQKADIFVSMSWAESWGQVYLEAMASHLPILTTKNQGAANIVCDGRFGYFVNMGDYLDLAHKVKLLINNPKQLQEFGEEARKEAEEKYDWGRRVMPSYFKLYESLA